MPKNGRPNLNLETLSEQARRVLAQAQSHLDEIERGNGD
jgi:hypothetical protein